MIRKYIDMIEEAFGRKTKIKPFGKQDSFPKPLPQNENLKKELEDCKRYKSAEEYDYNHNRYYPISGFDPPQIKANAEEESERLKARWNHWKNMGYF